MELEKIVAANITELRKSRQLTQLELAEKLNYSDKTISKWERGDGLPDLKTICRMAEIFGVSVDYFVTEGASEEIKTYSAPKEEKGYHILISLLGTAGIWIAAAIFYAYTLSYRGRNIWMVFIWAIPLSAALLYRLNLKWGKTKYEIIYTSIFCWTLLTSIFLQFLKYNMWPIFLIGVPVQVALILLTILRVKYHK